jgi:hypothetical protein
MNPTDKMMAASQRVFGVWATEMERTGIETVVPSLKWIERAYTAAFDARPAVLIQKRYTQGAELVSVDEAIVNGKRYKLVEIA